MPAMSAAAAAIKTATVMSSAIKSTAMMSA